MRFATTHPAVSGQEWHGLERQDRWWHGLGWFLILGSLLAGLHALGSGPLATPPLRVTDPGIAAWQGWWATTDPVTALLAVARLGASGVAWYLVAVSLLGVLGRRWRWAARLVRWGTVAGLRRLLPTLLGVSLALAGPTSPASATPAASGGPSLDLRAREPVVAAQLASEDHRDAAAANRVGEVYDREGPGSEGPGGEGPGGEVRDHEVDDGGSDTTRLEAPLRRRGAPLPGPEPDSSSGSSSSGSSSAGSSSSEVEAAPAEEPTLEDRATEEPRPQERAPDEPTPEVPSPEVATERTGANHRVVAGESFWSIAVHVLDTAGVEHDERVVATYWRVLVAANEDRLVLPGEPDLIFPGQELVLPPLDAEVAAGGAT